MQQGALESLQKSVMEFLGNSCSLFEAHVFLPDPLFFLFTRFNFRCAHVPSSDSAFLHQGVVSPQEPAVDAVFSKLSCIKFKRVTPGKPTLACSSRPLHIVGMNCHADQLLGPKLLKCQTCIFPSHPICVYPLAVRSQHHNYLGNKINELLKLLLRTLTLGYIDHGPHELVEIAGLVEYRMAQAVNVPDPFVGMDDSVPKLEICLVADGSLPPFPARGLIVGMNTLKEFFK